MTWRTASRHVIPVEDEINGQGQTDYLFSLEERQQVDYSRKGKFLPWSSKSLANTKEVLCKSWIQSCQGMLKELRLQHVSKVSVLRLAGLIAHLSWRLIVLQWLESSRRDVMIDR
ncbi:hypothetical protein BDA96_10G302200 [Sorghum bicolor]|uniref:Uncharacterized protein n=1 Tax=Sorghum bicolor TaxID=4558 RepID=A0A921Q516_SORBI|nr:hypothetical protein BDA96_10G302200 [Sorghum bicolor]